MPSIARQRTIGREVRLQGRGLFSGRDATMALLPAAAGTGVVFRRTDLPGAPEAAATVDALVAAERHTALRVGDGAVAMIEHLMAALMGLRIDNLLVELDAAEAPCLDGSALEVAQAILDAGIVEQDADATVLRLEGEVVVSADGAEIAARPADGLRVVYAMDYGDAFLGRRSVAFDVTPEAFLREIAPARTYALRPEVEAFVSRGLGRGATPENVLIVERDGRTTPAERLPDECCRHKALDLLGDLRLIGCRLHADVTASGSGHALNHRLAAELLARGVRSGP